MRRCLYVLYDFWLKIKNTTKQIKRRVWNKRILFLWYGLCTPDDEFHPSLYNDKKAMSVMTLEGRREYMRKIQERRNKIHERDG